MGKIFNALEKYRSERNGLNEPAEPLQQADLDALIQYNRHIGKLNIKAPSIIRDPGTVRRLIGNHLILDDGRVTEAGRMKCDELTYQLRVSLAGRPEQRLPSLGPTVESAASKIARRQQEPLLKTPAPAPTEPKRPVAPTPPPMSVELEEDDLIEAYESEAKPPLPLRESARISSVPVGDTVAAIDPNLVSLLTPQSFESEQFKILRTNLLFPVSGEAPRSVLITSVHPGDGKSFVAANLAVSVALNINRHVLLVDADLRKPTIHKQFGFGEAPGLSEYLSKGVALSSLLLQTKVDRLTILPGGGVPQNPSELLSSGRMSSLVEEITNRYKDRLIVIDSPPPTLTAETGVLARLTEGIILVVRYYKTGRNELRKLVDHLGREKIVGCTMNYFDYSSSGLYSYRAYRKYGGYKQY
jgi:capsular exopolysaccharide synthesis family protein